MKSNVILIVAALAVAEVVALLLTSTETLLVVQPTVKTVGISTPVSVHVTNRYGVRRLTAYVEQGGARYPVFEETAPTRRWLFWRYNSQPRTVTFEAGKNKAPALKPGKSGSTDPGKL